MKKIEPKKKKNKTRKKEKRRKLHPPTMVMFPCYSRSKILKILVPLYVLLFLVFTCEADPWSIVCQNTTIYYNQNSAFKRNLDTLLSTLSDNSGNNLFYNWTVGDAAPDMVYGFYMCRGDVTNDVCRDCVANATQDALVLCPKDKAVNLRYDLCMLRYDNTSFFSRMDAGLIVYSSFPQNVSEPDRFSEVLGDAMNDLATRVSSDLSNNISDGQVKGFGTNETKFSSFQNIYSLIQCTPDLSGTDCDRCFRGAIGFLPTCCYGKPMGRVMLPSCNIRYDTTPFYTPLAPSTPPAPGSSPPPQPQPPPSSAPAPRISPPSPTESPPTYLFHLCPDDKNTYNSNSTYEVNLKSLLSTFSSGNMSDSKFHNVSEGNGISDRVYGSFMCRGDVPRDVCRDCVARASRVIFDFCPKKKDAIIWYDKCMLRYSHTSFFSRMDESPVTPVFPNIQNQNRVFQNFMFIVMNDLAARVTRSYNSNDNSGQIKGFGTNETNDSRFGTIYSLVQCTPDLSSNDCFACFRVAFSRLSDSTCCSQMLGGKILLPSCYVRFENYPFYSRAPPSSHLPTTPAPPPGNKKLSAGEIIGIVFGVISCILLFVLGLYFLQRRREQKHHFTQEPTDENDILIAESLQYGLNTIGAATDNFSGENKIGEGGFGSVFKGTLLNGQEIAVKRLSKGSPQGSQEFKNEVVLVAKLQHKNLVRLVGFCLEQEEKLLIYEFVPNKSLDYFLFDPTKQKLLDWSTRYKIIGGIALGILYLHEHSRLKIIHRDLKASNILLDRDMNPKISDFGIARLVGVDESQTNTNRIVGTFGYMAPEYIMEGEFSIKSDVFSFGVLLLEIISGNKNRRSHQSGGIESLLSHAWKLWKDGRPLDLLDPTLGDTFVKSEVIQCLHIGLLCVQENPDERPTMSSVLLMFNGYSIALPLPRQPAFVSSNAEGMLEKPEMDSKAMLWSENELSLGEFYPR